MEISSYDDLIRFVSEKISEQFFSQERDISRRALLLDSDIYEITRKIGLETTKIIYEKALNQHLEKKALCGLQIKRNPVIEFNVIFGRISIKSPYLWKNGESYKPLRDEMKITHNGRSETVSRALTDFGSEESFERAAERFKEHYKYDTGPSAARRVAEAPAEEPQSYIENKLKTAGGNYAGGCSRRAVTMLIEADGCDIRTMQLKLKENTAETSPVRGLPKKERITEWKEVRIGFARPMDSVSKLYVGKMDTYPKVICDLFNVSVLSGLTPESRVIAVADGAPGLKEEMESQFENIQFILDKQHLKDHFYETSEELGIPEKERKGWVTPRVEAVSKGEADIVLNELEKIYSWTENKRVKRLTGYIKRFYHAVNYDKFKEKGYPNGSGEIESAHKSIPQQRLKIPGASWDIRSVNPMLSLRILRADDWWEDFWKNRTDKILKAA